MKFINKEYGKKGKYQIINQKKYKNKKALMFCIIKSRVEF